ncbi:hypothetical protein GCM10025771_37900 [Niveibacterium umoris]|uniref:Pimeloyl-ACP methyl ester carboxylesterase n=1 Tax=Niveibacterium umoris TaxID=1193620 RepID=A0A840BHB5_9RHOO|nr:alpha/beta hydrolase [Niveibacterium umoris]MBB4011009.1 pimeloyl-ACP methyl ester carboxylesterase [Niveibacterium umoris]
MPPRFSELQRNVREVDSLAVLHGEVSGARADNESIIVAAIAGTDDVPLVANYGEVLANGRYLLRVTAGTSYRLVAFLDANRNLRLDEGERVGVLPARALGVSGRPVGGLNIALDPKVQLSTADRRALGGLNAVKRIELPVAMGSVVDIDDATFTPEVASKGLWAPSDFLSEVGGGVYFLQPYSAARVPVLFVHGAGGNPREFEVLINALDRDRFQPWVYYYPSGVRLEAAAQGLDSIISALRRELGFSRMIITAHSMGGLVSMAYIKRQEASGKRDLVPLLVTLATPWRGHRAAALGVKHAPVAIPSWIDMQEDSDLQQALFSRPLASSTRFALLFGFHGDSGDGTISLASQLRPEAQRDAEKVLGFDETHTSILRSEAVRDNWLMLLDSVVRPKH